MRAVFLVIAVAAFSPARATSYIQEPVKTYFDQANTVAVVHVQRTELIYVEIDGKRTSCGSKSIGTVADSLKGKTGEIAFLVSGAILVPGEKYLLFLDQPKGNEDADKIDALMQGPNGPFFYCYSNSKDFRASWLTISGFVIKWNPKEQRYDDWIEPAYNIELPEDSSLVRQRVQLQSILVDGIEVKKNYWYMGDDFALPMAMRFFEGSIEWNSYRNYILNSTK